MQLDLFGDSVQGFNLCDCIDEKNFQSLPIQLLELKDV